jgi:peroxiredoxin
MARTFSNMLPLKAIAPEFSLPDTISEKTVSFKEHTGSSGTVVFFICNHCPFVIHVIDKIVEIAHLYQQKGISFLGISSNDVKSYPEDSPEKMKEFAQAKGFTFPYLYDETQEIAHAYDAACTPDFYLFNNSNELVYRGRMDGATPGNDIPVSGNELTTALNHLIEGKAITNDQKPSIGCNIKWKKE